MAVAHQLVERAHRFLDRRSRIEAMNLIQVDVLQLHPLQARLDAVHDVTTRRTTRIGALAHVAEHLGRDHDVFARDLQVLQRLTGNLFRQSARVHVGRVDEIDNTVDRLADQPLGIALLQVADLSPDAVAATEGHGAEAKF